MHVVDMGYYYVPPQMPNSCSGSEEEGAGGQDGWMGLPAEVVLTLGGAERCSTGASPGQLTGHFDDEDDGSWVCL